MKLKTITSIALLIFVFLFVSLVLFGKFGLATDSQATTTFKVGFFMLIIFVLSAVYIMNLDLLQGIAEHTITIVGIILISVILTMTMQNMKEGYITKATLLPAQLQLKNEVTALEQNVQGTSTTQQELTQQIADVNSQNQLLESQMKTLAAQKAALQKEAELQAKQKQLEEQQKAWAQALAEQQAAYEQAMADQQAAYEAAIRSAQRASAASSAPAPAATPTPAPAPTPREREHDD